jgi:hypothetical protein
VSTNHRQLVRYEKNGLELLYIGMPKIIIFQKITCAKNAFLRAELPLKFSDQLIEALIGGEIIFLKMGHVGYQMSVFLRRFQKCKLTLKISIFLK